MRLKQHERFVVTTQTNNKKAMLTSTRHQRIQIQNEKQFSHAFCQCWNWTAVMIHARKSQLLLNNKVELELVFRYRCPSIDDLIIDGFVVLMHTNLRQMENDSKSKVRRINCNYSLICMIQCYWKHLIHGYYLHFMKFLKKITSLINQTNLNDSFVENDDI